MKMLMKTALAGVAVMALALPALAEPLKATWTDPDDPANAPVAAQMNVLKDAAARFSGGEIDIELFPNGQLGDQRAMVQQVRRGTIHFANIASGVLASLYAPELSIVDMPFLFKSRAHFRATMDAENEIMKNLFDKVAEDTGVRVLSLNPYGFRNITTKGKAVHSPADLEGLKIRTMEIVPHQEMVRAMGATPVPIPYLELYTSLQTGVVDGQENPPSNIILMRFFQVQDHMTETQHVMTTGAVITNEEWWQGLSDDNRNAILDALKEAELAHDGVGAVKDLLGVNTIREEGMTVYTPTTEEMAAFREAAVEPTKAWAMDALGEEFVTEFFDHMASFEKN
ncbi:MAG: TRAP transporter substrate-binding protein [Acuticoccus sp.]